MSRDNTEKVVWFLMGAAIGAGVALLYAPQSGQDTRRYLRKKGENARDAVVEKGQELGDDIVDRGRKIYQRGVAIAEDASELLERGRKLVRG